MSIVRVVSPRLSPIERREVLRYAGVRGASGRELSEELSELEAKISSKLTPKGCFTELAALIDGDMVQLGEFSVRSASLSALLSGCKSAIVLAATVGIGADREISRLGASSPSRQLLLDAICTERIEALCDSLCELIGAELSAENKKLTRRFSAGYGDLPLAFQREIFSILDCPRKIGLTLNESLLMTPTKSVTAIVGVLG